MSTTGTLTTYLENKLINHLLLNTAYTPPASVWLALYTISPSEIKNGTEVSGGGYVRQNISASLTISGNYANNTTAILFPEATSGWGTIVGIAIMDASINGNMLFWGIMSNEKTISAGESFFMGVGNLTLELRGGTKGGWGEEIPQQILNLVLKNTPFTSPTNVYIATGSALSYDEDYNFVDWGETSAAGYSRKTATWYSPTNGSSCNLSDVVFSAPPIAQEWGRITNIVIFDSSTSGKSLLWGKLYSPIYITVGDGLKFPIGEISIIID